jgi:hypothetical protein
MPEISFLVLVLVIAWAFRRSIRKGLSEQWQEIELVKGQVKDLRKSIESLKTQIGLPTSKLEEGRAATAKLPEPTVDRWLPTAAEVPREEKKAPLPEPEKRWKPLPERDFGAPKPAEPIGKPKPAPAEIPEPIRETQPLVTTALDNFVAKFLENWTGILGTIVLVAGIGFVGTYAALQLSPFFRFLMVLGASAALYAGYFSLRKRAQWQTMSLWLRSAAAAVLLFACAASGGLPNAGLMWIDATGPALAVLMVGIAANLGLSWRVGRQGFAALHVVLALVPIAILPQNPLALGIATIISAFGVFLTHRQRWPGHLLVTLVAYLLFHVYWVYKQGAGLPLPDDLLPLALSGAIVVFLGGALAHYNPVFKVESAGVDALASHLVSWGLLIAAVGIHLKDVTAWDGQLLGMALLALSLIAWTMSASAKRRGLEWLRTTDVLIAQGLLVASLFTWRAEFAEPAVFYGMIFAETLLFLRLVINDHGPEEVRVGAMLAVLAALGFAAAGALSLDSVEQASSAWGLAGVMVAGVALTILAGYYFDRAYCERLKEHIGADALLVVGCLAGLMTLVAQIAIYEQIAVGAFGLVAGAGFVFGARKLSSLGLVWGAWLVVLAAHLIAWLLCFDAYAGKASSQIVLLAPAIALSVCAIWRAPIAASKIELRVVAIYLLGINLGIAPYLLLGPQSSLLPTVSWLVMSLVVLEVAGRLKEPPQVLPTLHIGYAYIAAAAIGYITVVIPTVSYVGPINLRMAIEIFGMAVLMYWWLARPGEPLASREHWTYVRPYFLEVTLAVLTATVFVETALVWRPVAWVVIALVFLLPAVLALATRFAFYSLIAFYTSLVALTVNVATVSVPSPIWYEQPWNTGLIAIAIQVTYLFAAYRRLALDNVTFPSALHRLTEATRSLGQDTPATLCYPFFTGLALFLAWRFEQAFLTFLWSAEAFVVFVMSILFRENHFRLVALSAIAVCLGRLLIYDMQATDLFTRGLVFIGVGLLMLGMNAVYNKYGRTVDMR